VAWFALDVDVVSTGVTTPFVDNRPAGKGVSSG
jgi:hypothetical protein